MKTANNHRGISRVAAVFAACIILLAGAGTAYAANVGNIQRIIQLWRHGDQTAAVIEFDGNGGYSYSYSDEVDGNRVFGMMSHKSGEGERPLTEEELQEVLNLPEVEYRADGTVWVYWYDQAVEITDKFEDDICYVKLEHDGKTMYVTVKYQESFRVDPSEYPNPVEFHTQRSGGGGGVAFNPDGTQRPLTEEELMDQINMPDVEYRDDGSVWVYWFDQKVEITDKFVDDVCYVKLVSGEETAYMTIKYQNGYGMSPDKYIEPWEFN